MALFFNIRPIILYIMAQRQLYIPVESNIPPLVTVAMPKNTYPSNTDFEGGYFTVIEDTQLNQTQCTDIMFEPTLKNVQHKKQVTINAITYAEGSDGGVGGGHQAEDEFFMTFHNNICFRLQEGTRTGGYGDSDAITKQVDVNDVFAKLYLVTQTFKFTK